MIDVPLEKFKIRYTQSENCFKNYSTKITTRIYRELLNHSYETSLLVHWINPLLYYTKSRSRDYRDYSFDSIKQVVFVTRFSLNSNFRLNSSDWRLLHVLCHLMCYYSTVRLNSNAHLTSQELSKRNFSLVQLSDRFVFTSKDYISKDSTLTVWNLFTFIF